jgi:hypothetical protein
MQTGCGRDVTVFRLIFCAVRLSNERSNIAGDVKNFGVVVTRVCIVKLDDHTDAGVDDDWDGKGELDVVLLGVGCARKGDRVGKPWQPLWALGKKDAARDARPGLELVLAAVVAIALEALGDHLGERRGHGRTDVTK